MLKFKCICGLKNVYKYLKKKMITSEIRKSVWGQNLYSDINGIPFSMDGEMRSVFQVQIRINGIALL